MHEEPREPAIRSSGQFAVLVGDQSLAEDEERRPRRRRRRSDWRLGGRSVRRWGTPVLIGGLVGAGIGIMSASVVASFRQPWSPMLSLIAFWVGLAAAVVFAVSRARPSGLFRFRAQDLLWGLGLGMVLRVTQGLLEGASSAPFPSSALFSTSPLEWITANVVPSSVVGPMVEELFFRAVLLVSVYQMCRRSIGAISAGLTAVLGSTGAFVCLHAVFAPLNLAAAFQLALLAAVCGGLVLLTGRVWAAIVTHVVYNSTFFLLIAVGSILG